MTRTMSRSGKKIVSRIGQQEGATLNLNLMKFISGIVLNIALGPLGSSSRRAKLQVSPLLRKLGNLPESQKRLVLVGAFGGTWRSDNLNQPLQPYRGKYRGLLAENGSNRQHLVVRRKAHKWLIGIVCRQPSNR
jgi:hypothetical protein